MKMKMKNIIIDSFKSNNIADTVNTFFAKGAWTLFRDPFLNFCFKFFQCLDRF